MEVDSLKLGVCISMAVLLSGICVPTYGNNKAKVLLDDPEEAAEAPNVSRQDPIGCSFGIPNTPKNRKMILERNVFAFFDPECLSNKQARICCDVTISSNSGMPKYKISSTSKVDAADIFYCEQAIWETLPLDQKITSDIDGTIEFTSKIGKERGPCTWPELHSSERGIVRLHFVPASVKRRIIAAFDVGAAENVVRLQLGDAKSPKLQAFRQEWVSFLDSHARLDSEELHNQKRLMRQKFEGLFLNP